MKFLRMVKEKYVKYMAFALALAILVTGFSFPSQEVYADSYQDDNGVIVTQFSNGDVSSELSVDDTKFVACYSKDSDEYSLYINDNLYRLSGEIVEDKLILGIVNNDDHVSEEKVVGQAAIALPLIYWTPTLIAAAKAVIASTVAVIGGYSIWYIADDIAAMIDATYVKPGAPSQSVGAFYAAELINGKVVISSEITAQEATNRLIAGRDIFATTSQAAQSAASMAGVNMGFATPHSAHGGDGYYPHWHPHGRKWYKNPSHSPHAWYGRVTE